MTQNFSATLKIYHIPEMTSLTSIALPFKPGVTRRKIFSNFIYNHISEMSNGNRFLFAIKLEITLWKDVKS